MTEAPSHIALVRRRNALALFRAWAEAAVAGGSPPKGLEQAFAASLQISPSMWSQLKGSRPIGDKLARQIESRCGKPVAWLDAEGEQSGLTPAEQQFIGLALAAWRASRPDARRALRAQLKSLL